MFGSIGPWELIVILTIALLLFGKRLPEVGRALGRGIVEFRRGLRGIEDEIEQAEKLPPVSQREGNSEKSGQEDKFREQKNV